MNIQDVPLFGQTIDKSEVPPIHQKRILAFVNHFIIKTCSFLNDFALKCESKFVNVERKLQKVEASLVIIESKLSSISGLEKKEEIKDVNVVIKETTKEELNQDSQINDDIAKETEEIPNIDCEIKTGVKACDDDRYRKYFKMVQFGVPTNAVKMKMETEGFDPNILNNPDMILPDGISHEDPAS